LHRRRDELEREHDERIAVMVARTVALWVPRGKRAPQPEYFAPWIDIERREPVRKQQTPQEIFAVMRDITALQKRREEAKGR